MAIRTIVLEDDPVLRKKSRPVEKFDQRLWELLDDMADTMHKAQGVGLAAPQVGVLRRVVVVDIGEGVMELVNPEILETSGAEEDSEGCLSFPGEYGVTKRPYRPGDPPHPGEDQISGPARPVAAAPEHLPADGPGLLP